MNVATSEMTLCDCLQYISSVGFINNVATVLLELQEKIDMARLTQYVKKDYLALVNVQRLGYLIDYLELSLPTDELYRWLTTQSFQYRPLVPSNPMTTGKNKKWKIIVNELLDPDEI